MRICLTGLSSGVLVPRDDDWPGVAYGIGRSIGPLAIVTTTICEVSGINPAKVVFYDGEDTTGEIVLPITLLANESTRDIYATSHSPGLELYTGAIYYDLVLGQIQGSIEIT